MENIRPKLIVICGPTASGKSDIAVELCIRVGGEVISADSMQIYRRMDIGTGKISIPQMRGISHHMLDVFEPTDNVTASVYGAKAKAIINDIVCKEKQPVLCGGTGLYIDAVTRGIRFSVPANEAIRCELHAIAEEMPYGKQKLHGILEKCDPGAAARLHPNDVRRIVRAIESYRSTGKTQAQLAEEDAHNKGDYDEYLFMPKYPRDELYARIDRRVDSMFKNGLVDEVKQLLSSGVTSGMTSMQAIGYKETVRYLNSEISYDDAVCGVKQASRNYAKRQETWFRRDGRVRYIEASGKTAESLAEEILCRYQNEVNDHE